MSHIFKPFPEKDYNEIISEVGKYRYHIYNKGESVPGNIFKRLLDLEKYNCVVAGTGSALASYSVKIDTPQPIVVPQDSPIIVVRLLRYDDKHGEPHYNADDQLIFPVMDGHVLRLSRKDAPDHFIAIIQNSRLATITEAYRLPEAKQGDIKQYSEKGAKLQVELSP